MSTSNKRQLSLWAYSSPTSTIVACSFASTWLLYVAS
jgi:hypothetical protein